MATEARSESSTVVTVTAIYFVIVGLFNICGSLTLILGGSILGGLGGLFSSGEFQELIDEAGEEGAEAAEVVQAATAGSGLLTILGIIGLVIAIAVLVDAVGLFQKKPWSHRLTIILSGAYIVITVLQALSGGGLGILQIVFIVISGAIIYFFYSDEGTKRTLGVP